MAVALAIDIGGTKLEVGAVDQDGRILHRARAATESRDPWPGLVELVDSVAYAAVSAGHEPSAVGVGCGGPMSAGGELVSPLNIGGWRDFPLREHLTSHTGLAVRVDNDAKALALGEGWHGAAEGETDYLAMVVSTGVGAGIVLNGKLLDGATGNAGHIGHVIVEPDGRACACGTRGCLEAEASGLSIERATGRPAAEADAETIERTGRLVGRGVATVANLLDLKLAVVAGSVALGMGKPFFEAAQAELDARARISFAARRPDRPRRARGRRSAGGRRRAGAGVALRHGHPMVAGG